MVQRTSQVETIFSYFDIRYVIFSLALPVGKHIYLVQCMPKLFQGDYVTSTNEMSSFFLCQGYRLIKLRTSKTGLRFCMLPPNKLDGNYY